ncbi:MAG: tetratricopeptide repeat protein [Candidatus Moraniibacteriota bacterium]
MTIKNKKRFTLFIAVVIFLGSSLGYYFYLNKSPKISGVKNEQVDIQKSMSSGNFDEATRALKERVKKDDSLDNLKMLAVSQYNQGDFKGAKKNFEKLIERDEINVYEYYNSLGNIYRDQKKPQKAEENYKKAIEAKPDYETAYQNLVILYLYEITPREKEKAKDVIDKGLEKNPESDKIENLEKMVN